MCSFGFKTLKQSRDGNLFKSAERPFHNLAPLKEKHFCLFVDILFGILRSVSVFLRLHEVNFEFLSKRFSMWWGANWLGEDHIFRFWVCEFLDGTLCDASCKVDIDRMSIAFGHLVQPSSILFCLAQPSLILINIDIEHLHSHWAWYFLQLFSNVESIRSVIRYLSS